LRRFLITITGAKWNRDEWPKFVDKTVDIPANCLYDLNPEHNSLSVWELADDESNFERLATALAANRDNLSHIDCLLFRGDVFSSLGLTTLSSKGKTPDEHANQQSHRDLNDLSGKVITDFAIKISQHGETKRISKKQILEMLKKGVQKKELSIESVPEKLRAKIVGLAPIASIENGVSPEEANIGSQPTVPHPINSVEIPMSIKDHCRAIGALIIRRFRI